MGVLWEHEYQTNQSKSCAHILGPKWFAVRVELHQGCPSSPILFVVFMDRIWRCSRGAEGVWFGNLRVTSLLFADDVVPLASSSHDLQFTAECEAARMNVSSSRSEAMVLKSSPSGSGMSLCLSWRSFSISGSCSQ